MEAIAGITGSLELVDSEMPCPIVIGGPLSVAHSCKLMPPPELLAADNL